MKLTGRKGYCVVGRSDSGRRVGVSEVSFALLGHDIDSNQLRVASSGYGVLPCNPTGVWVSILDLEVQYTVHYGHRRAVDPEEGVSVGGASLRRVSRGAQTVACERVKIV